MVFGVLKAALLPLLPHLSVADAFAPVLYSMGGRQLQQVACNFQGDKDKQTSGWISFLFSNGE